MGPGGRPVSPLNVARRGGKITPVNGHILATGAGRHARGARRAAVLLLTIGALLFVGLQSRVAQSIPSRSSERLLTSLSDPVKFPPPEERGIDSGWVLNVAAGDAVPEPPARPLREEPPSISYFGERHSAAHLLRAPPVSL